MTTNKPFQHNYFLGYVSSVYPECVEVYFPSSTLLKKFVFSGEKFNSGLIGNFVTIEGEDHGFIGRIIEIGIMEKERLKLTEKAFKNFGFHPKGKLEILLSFDYFDLKVAKGLDCFPNIGSKVFVCPSDFLKRFLTKFGCKKEEENYPLISLGILTANRATELEISQQSLFGRHCAVVGTTGGGKSWTVAKLMEGINKNGTKAIILDATGEYKDINYMKHVSLPKDSYFHYSKLTIDDLFLLLRPSGQVQSPILMGAVRSLKIVKLLLEKSNQDIKNENGCLTKAGQLKVPVQKFYNDNITEIETNQLDIDITKLAQQVNNECVWDDGFSSGKSDPKLWGKKDDKNLSHCLSLISRINNLLNASHFKEIFGFDKNKSGDLTEKIDTFIGYDLQLMSDEVEIKANSLYVKKTDDGELQYTVITPKKEKITANITVNDLKNEELKKVLSEAEAEDLLTKLRPYLNDILEITSKKGHTPFIKLGTKNIFRIGFEDVGYDFQGREILANAIAKYLLLKARAGEFKENPTILFVDEAHQYLNKNVKDEFFNAKPLDSFDQIAKECRKYGLFLCLATQMPRDIPIGTLSQMGTFIVHRLINYHDKEAIANACSSANKNSLSFLPVLGEGEAILTGIDFPMPLSIKINEPNEKPNSDTPLFKKQE